MKFAMQMQINFSIKQNLHVIAYYAIDINSSQYIPAVGYLTLPLRQKARKYIPTLGYLTLSQRQKRSQYIPVVDYLALP